MLDYYREEGSLCENYTYIKKSFGLRSVGIKVLIFSLVLKKAREIEN